MVGNDLDENLMYQACSPLLSNPSLAVENERLWWFVTLCSVVSEKAKGKQMVKEDKEEEDKEEEDKEEETTGEEEEEEAPPSPTPLSRDEMRSMLERAETCLGKREEEGGRSLEEAVRLASCVLEHFPDSVRGLRTRGLARAARLSAIAAERRDRGAEEGCEDVEGCIADLSKAQSIDYDHEPQVALKRAIEMKEEKRKNMVLRKEEDGTLEQQKHQTQNAMPTSSSSSSSVPNAGGEGGVGGVTGNDFQNAMKSMMQNPDVLRTAQEMLKDPATLMSISDLAKGLASG